MWISVMTANGQDGASATLSAQPILDRLKLGGRHLAALFVALEFEGELLALVQRAEARTFHGRDVHEDVGAAVIRLNEAEALGGVEPLHGASRHGSLSLPCKCSRAPYDARNEIVGKVMEDSGARSEEQAWRATEPRRYSIDNPCALFCSSARKLEGFARRHPRITSSAAACRAPCRSGSGAGR